MLTDLFWIESDKGKSKTTLLNNSSKRNMQSWKSKTNSDFFFLLYSLKLQITACAYFPEFCQLPLAKRPCHLSNSFLVTTGCIEIPLILLFVRLSKQHPQPLLTGHVHLAHLVDVPEQSLSFHDLVLVVCTIPSGLLDFAHLVVPKLAWTCSSTLFLRLCALLYRHLRRASSSLKYSSVIKENVSLLVDMGGGAVHSLAVECICSFLGSYHWPERLKIAPPQPFSTLSLEPNSHLWSAQGYL